MIIRANKEEGLTGAQRSGRTFLLLGLVSICLWAATPASAGMVSGQVRENGRILQNEMTLELRDSMNNLFIVRTDRSGRYRVNLPPGIYRVSKINDRRKRALIQSSPQQSYQDINFGGR